MAQYTHSLKRPNAPDVYRDPTESAPPKLTEFISSSESAPGQPHICWTGDLLLPIYILAPRSSSHSRVRSRALINNVGLPSSSRLVDCCWVCLDLGRVGLIRDDAICLSIMAPVSQRRLIGEGWMSLNIPTSHTKHHASWFIKLHRLEIGGRLCVFSSLRQLLWTFLLM